MKVRIKSQDPFTILLWIDETPSNFLEGFEYSRKTTRQLFLPNRSSSFIPNLPFDKEVLQQYFPFIWRDVMLRYGSDFNPNNLSILRDKSIYTTSAAIIKSDSAISSENIEYFKNNIENFLKYYEEKHPEKFTGKIIRNSFAMRKPRFRMTIGLELEGGFLKKRGQAIYIDNSVHIPESKTLLSGEKHSPVFKNLKNLKTWLNKNYPCRMNSTCGLHVHIGVPNEYYMLFATEEFFNFLLSRIQEWGKKNRIKSSEFWGRLQGDNDYCMPIFRAYSQIESTIKSSCRYTAINYPYLQHYTIEVRVLPMFKSPNLSFSAIRRIVNSFQLWARTRKTAS